MATEIEEKIDPNEVLGWAEPTEEIFTPTKFPESAASNRINNIAGVLVNFFQRELRERLYYFVNIHKARNAALSELDMYTESKVDEVQKYLDELKEELGI